MLGRPKSFIPSFQVTEPSPGHHFGCAPLAMGGWIFSFAVWHTGAGLSHPLDFSSLAGVWEGLGFLSSPPKGLHLKMGRQNTAVASWLEAPISLLVNENRWQPGVIASRLPCGSFRQRTSPSAQLRGHPAGSGSRKAPRGPLTLFPLLLPASPISLGHLCLQFWNFLPALSVLGPHLSFFPSGLQLWFRLQVPTSHLNLSTGCPVVP